MRHTGNSVTVDAVRQDEIRSAVQRLYNEDAEREWERAERHPTEFSITLPRARTAPPSGTLPHPGLRGRAGPLCDRAGAARLPGDPV